MEVIFTVSPIFIHSFKLRAIKNMHVTLFFCENVNTGTDGKLNVQGIYSELYSAGFPAKQDLVTLAGIIEWDHDDHGKQTFKIDIVDPDDQSIFTIDANSEIEVRSGSRPPAISHLIFSLENLVFTQAGQYRTVMTLKNEKIPGPSLNLLYTNR